MIVWLAKQALDQHQRDIRFSSSSFDEDNRAKALVRIYDAINSLEI
jgi:hypothetical protein